jgi:hypothetical protein
MSTKAEREAKKAAKAAEQAETTEQAQETTKKPTKKSICVEFVRRPEGATIEEMGKAQTDAGLGDLERNIKTSKLWMAKLGFPVRHDKETGRYFQK